MSSGAKMPTGPAGDEFLPPSDPKKKGTPRRAGTVAQPHVLKDEGVDPIEQAKADAEFAAWRVERKQRRAREAEEAAARPPAPAPEPAAPARDDAPADDAPPPGGALSAHRSGFSLVEVAAAVAVAAIAMFLAQRHVAAARASRPVPEEPEYPL